MGSPFNKKDAYFKNLHRYKKSTHNFSFCLFNLYELRHYWFKWDPILFKYNLAVILFNQFVICMSSVIFHWVTVTFLAFSFFHRFHDKQANSNNNITSVPQRNAT